MQITHGQITLDNISWTPLRAPSDCKRVKFMNITAVVMKVRTNQSLASTEISVQSFQDYPVEPIINSMIRDDDILAYAQLASGTAPISAIAQQA